MFKSQYIKVGNQYNLQLIKSFASLDRTLSSTIPGQNVPRNNCIEEVIWHNPVPGSDYPVLEFWSGRSTLSLLLLLARADLGVSVFVKGSHL